MCTSAKYYLYYKFKAATKFTKVANDNKYSHKALYIQALYKVLVKKKKIKNFWDAFSHLVHNKYQKKKEQKAEEVKASLPQNLNCLLCVCVGEHTIS